MATPVPQAELTDAFLTAASLLDCARMHALLLAKRNQESLSDLLAPAAPASPKQRTRM